MEKLMIKNDIGKIFHHPKGAIFKLKKIDDEGQFHARVISLKTRQWGNYVLTGDIDKWDDLIKDAKVIPNDEFPEETEYDGP